MQKIVERYVYAAARAPHAANRSPDCCHRSARPVRKNDASRGDCDARQRADVGNNIMVVTRARSFLVLLVCLTASLSARGLVVGHTGYVLGAGDQVLQVGGDEVGERPPPAEERRLRDIVRQERLERAQPVVLRLVRVQRGVGDLAGLELAGDAVGAVLRAGKNEHGVEVRLFQKRDEQRELQMPRHLVGHLRHGLGGIRAPAHLHGHRLMQKLPRQHLDLGR